MAYINSFRHRHPGTTAVSCIRPPRNQATSAVASLELYSFGALPSNAVCELQQVQAQAAGHHRVSEPEIYWRSLLANRGLPAAQYTELQQVKAQAAGYHRRDLDALQMTGRRYADLDLRARETFLKELEHVLGSLSWCVCCPEESDAHGTCLLGCWTCESCCGDHWLAKCLWKSAPYGPVEALHAASCQAIS